MSDALEQASLIMVPTGYEDGRLGSLKPLDGSGDFTFTRCDGASECDLAATRVNEQGYIEKGYQNLLVQSNSFDTTWSNTDGTNYFVLGGQEGYDGSNDAWLLDKQNTNNQYVSQSASVTGIYTASIYAKKGSADALMIYCIGGYARFSLNDGSIIGAGASPIQTKTEYVGNGWYKCIVTGSGTNIYSLQVWSTITGYTTGSVYIQDAMLNEGLVAYPYVETTTAPVAGGILEDMPRLDYSGSCPALLLEPERTNLVSHSEYFNDLYYVRDSGVSVLENQSISPEGITNACKVSVNNNNRLYANNTSGTYIFSFFIKAGTFSHFRFGGANIDLTTSPISTGEVDFEDYGNGWYRMYYEYTGNRGFQIQAYPDNTYSPHTTSGNYYLYGHQVEVGSYPTSYIPTYGRIQTRLADNCHLINGTSLPTAYPFTIYAEVPVVSGINCDVVSFSNTLRNDEYYSLFYFNNRFSFSLRPNRNITDIVSSSTYGSGTHKVAVVVTDSSAELFVNGTLQAVTSAVEAFNSLINDVLIGQLRILSDLSRRNSVNQVIIFPTALSDDECIELTTI